MSSPGTEEPTSEQLQQETVRYDIKTERSHYRGTTKVAGGFLAPSPRGGTLFIPESGTRITKVC